MSFVHTNTDPESLGEFERVHQAALAVGLRVTRSLRFGKTQLFEYDRARGTYARLASTDGLYHIDAPFEEVIAKWGSPDCTMPIVQVKQVKVAPSATKTKRKRRPGPKSSPPVPAVAFSLN